MTISVKYCVHTYLYCIAATEWAVMCVINSDQIGECHGALPDQVQKNNRVELVDAEEALQLAWGSTRVRCRVIEEYNLVCLGAENNSEEWAWSVTLGMRG